MRGYLSRSPRKFTCPRMSVGYAEALPFRHVPSSWDNIKRDNKDKPQAYRTTLLGVRPVSPLKRETSFGRLLKILVYWQKTQFASAQAHHGERLNPSIAIISSSDEQLNQNNGHC